MRRCRASEPSRLPVLLLALLVWSLPSIAIAVPLTGDLGGTFTGRLAGATADVTGTITGSWTADVTLGTTATVNSVTATGSFGGPGVSGTWGIAGYDPATNTISVTWTAPGNRGPSSLAGSGTADGSASLQVNTTTGVATGSFTGRVFTDGGEKTITGTWTIQFQGLSRLTRRGSVVGTWTGTATYLGPISGTVSGNWTARFLPDGTISAEASGTFQGGPYAVQTPVGTQQVVISGTYIVTLSRDSRGNYALTGSWTHPVLSGVLGALGGGEMTWNLDLGRSPMGGDGTFSGQGTFTVPTFGSATVSTRGTYEVTLSITQ